MKRNETSGSCQATRCTDLRQTSQYAHYLQLQGWKVAKINKTYIFSRQILGFSLVKIQRPKNTPGVGEVLPRGVGIIYLEPLDKKQAPPDFKLKKSTFLPSRTLIIDLEQSEEKIFNRMQKDARYAIRKSSQTPLGCAQPSSLGVFHRAWRRSVSWRRWVPSLKSLQNLKTAFGKNALFLIATRQKQIIAGTVILVAARRAYYYYAFTNQAGRRLLAQYLLVWEAIKLAKKLGCEIFDFEGIYDQRFPDKSWQGFSHFKRSFGGQVIEYPGCFRKFILHLHASQRRRKSQKRHQRPGLAVKSL